MHLGQQHPANHANAPLRLPNLSGPATYPCDPNTGDCFHTGCTTVVGHIDQLAEPRRRDILPAARRMPPVAGVRILHAAAATANRSGCPPPECLRTASGRAAVRPGGLELARAVRTVHVAARRPGSRADLPRTGPAVGGSSAYRAVVARDHTGWSVLVRGSGRTVSGSQQARGRRGFVSPGTHVVAGKPGAEDVRRVGTRQAAQSRCSLPVSLRSSIRNSGSAADAFVSHNPHATPRYVVCRRRSTNRAMRRAAKHVRNSAHHGTGEAPRALVLSGLAVVVVLWRLATSR